MRYVTVQIQELINGKMTDIDHPWNRDEREAIGMGENIPADKLAKVKHGLGLTINMGNYQSAKVDVGVELPVHVDEIDKGFENASDISNDMLMDSVDTLFELKKAFGEKK